MICDTMAGVIPKFEESFSAGKQGLTDELPEDFELHYQYTIRLGREVSDDGDTEYDLSRFDANKGNIEAEVQKFLEKEIEDHKKTAYRWNKDIKTLEAKGNNELGLKKLPPESPLEDLLAGKKSGVIVYQEYDGRIEAHRIGHELLLRCFAAVGNETRVHQHYSEVTNLDNLMHEYIKECVEASNSMYLGTSKIIEKGVTPLEERM